MYSSSSVDKNTKTPPTDICLQPREVRPAATTELTFHVMISRHIPKSPGTQNVHCGCSSSLVNLLRYKPCSQSRWHTFQSRNGPAKGILNAVYSYTTYNRYVPLRLKNSKDATVQKTKNKEQRNSLNGCGRRCRYQPGMSSSRLGEPCRRSCLAVRRRFLTELRSDDRRRTNCLVSTAGSSWRLAITAN